MNLTSPPLASPRILSLEQSPLSAGLFLQGTYSMQITTLSAPHEQTSWRISPYSFFPHFFTTHSHFNFRLQSGIWGNRPYWLIIQTLKPGAVLQSTWPRWFYISNFICGFNIPLFLLQPCCLWVIGYRKPLNVMFFCPILHIMTTEMWPQSQSVLWGSLYMVLSFSNPLMVAVGFVWWQGKNWVKLNVVSTQTKAYLEPSLKTHTRQLEALWASVPYPLGAVLK